jgi:putative FmdB family regulatory protein
MPTYEFRCDEGCRSLVAEFLPRPPEEPPPCPTCGAPMTQCVGAGSPPIFKGSGFHCTDYRSDNYMKGAKGEKT